MTRHEEYAAVYKKNAERMAVLQALSEAARKRGDLKAAREYRRKYTDLKAEIDAKVFAVIMHK